MRVDSPPGLLAGLSERFQEALAIRIVFEDGPALVAAHHDVIDRAGILDAKGSGHRLASVKQRKRRVNPEMSQF